MMKNTQTAYKQAAANPLFLTKGQTRVEFKLFGN